MPEAKQRSFNPESVDEVVEFMGITMTLSSIQNPHLRRVIEKTAKGGFRFRYDDHSRRTHKESYADWSKSRYYETYSDYNDHRRYGDYSRAP